MLKSKLFAYIGLFILLLGLVSAVIYSPKTGMISLAKTAKKTKWQLLLERNQIPEIFWQKYLPKISRKEYRKALKKHARAMKSSAQGYFLHENVSTTIFWIGENSGPDNRYISNTQSAWDEKWAEHFGGVDDPENRSGYFPAGFTPLENPFYFALPYNDFDTGGNRRGSAAGTIPWFSEKTWSADESMCKNRWIKITKGDRTAYAQWEDVGPFLEDDSDYIFGSSTPKSSTNNHAGLDVSPAVRDYLGLSDLDRCAWQFVNAADVPDGPWKQIVTTSNIYWE